MRRSLTRANEIVILSGIAMTKTFDNFEDFEDEINELCGKAVRNACNRLLGILQQKIQTEFYDAFEPQYYKRTYQFWEAAVTRMFEQTCGYVLMDESLMDYGEYWTGARQLDEANKGSHGGYTTETSAQHKFWDSFIDFCDESAEKIIVQELKKQGIPLQ